MIGYLNGTIRHIGSESCIVITGGVGYEVYAPARTIQHLVLGETTELYIYTHVKEDQLKLIGFETVVEKDMFTAILGVNGVGPKTALLILSSGSVNDIQAAISEANVSFFTQIKGLGKKNAQKLIIELKGKLGSIQELDLTEKEKSYPSDVVTALMGFGFLKRDVIKTLSSLDTTLPESQLIKQALQHLGKA